MLTSSLHDLIYLVDSSKPFLFFKDIYFQLTTRVSFKGLIFNIPVKTVVKMIDRSVCFNSFCSSLILITLMLFQHQLHLQPTWLHDFPKHHSFCSTCFRNPVTLFISVHLLFLFFFFLPATLQLQSHLMTVSCSLFLAVTEGLLTRSCTPFTLSSSFHHAAATSPFFQL